MEVVTTEDQALCQLFFHCCFGDGEFKEQEMEYVSDLFVKFGLHTRLNIKNETMRYRNYRDTIQDEPAYLEELIRLINPVHGLALYSYCVEICLSDSSLDIREESLLEKIARCAGLDQHQAEIVKQLMVQRKTVSEQKIF